MDAEPLVRPVVEGAGLELMEVSYRRESGQQVLRVVVDGENGVDLDTIAETSEKISRRLDLEGFGRGSYQLEVSSPGIERPLKTPAQFRRVVGSKVKLKTTDPVDGQRVHQGPLLEADEDGVVVEVEGTPRRIGYADLVSARTVVEWDAELKGTRT